MKITDKVRIMESHYNALPILIGYVSKKASEGDEEAVYVLKQWDKERNCVPIECNCGSPGDVGR